MWEEEEELGVRGLGQGAMEGDVVRGKEQGSRLGL